MRIFITESDRQNAKKFALMSIARFYNINDYNFMEIGDSNIEGFFKILGEINESSTTEIISLTRAYFNAYDELFLFCQKVKKKEQATKKKFFINEEEKLKEKQDQQKQEKQLSILIEKREVSLQTLQEKFDEIQLLKLNFKIFNSPLSGKIMQG
jgi:hypothetical protein